MRPGRPEVNLEDVIEAAPGLIGAKDLARLAFSEDHLAIEQAREEVIAEIRFAWRDELAFRSMHSAEELNRDAFRS